MTPKAAIMTKQGLTVAIFMTKPPTYGRQDQEIHLIKLLQPAEELVKVYTGRN